MLLARACHTLELGHELARLRVERGFHARVKINGSTGATLRAYAEHGRREAAIFAHATSFSFDEDAGEARRQRKAREPGGHLAMGAKEIKDTTGMLHGFSGRRIEPVKIGGRGDAHGAQSSSSCESSSRAISGVSTAGRRR